LLSPTSTPCFPHRTHLNTNITIIEENILALGVQVYRNQYTEQYRNIYDELKRFDFDVVLLLCRLTGPLKKGCRNAKTNCTERNENSYGRPDRLCFVPPTPTADPFR
jgi:hypothetical protein